ncbi:hypothetical protein TNCV_1314051 [Trichonephila clavipes]|nr:hypothetical protein TNCV_1314051 [Trichonephila clavipes]
MEKQIQEIKTNKKYFLTRSQKINSPRRVSNIRPVAKYSTVTTTTQTDETITKIVFPPLKLLQPLISIPNSTMSSRIPTVTKSSTSTQAHILPSTSFAFTTTSESHPPIPLIDTDPATSNSLCSYVASPLSNKKSPFFIYRINVFTFTS